MAKLKVMTNSAFTIDTAAHLPKLHQNLIICGRCGSGKSVAATNLLRMYKETDSMDRIIVISPTFNSNKSLMKELNIREEDIFNDPDDPSLPQRIVDLVDAERDECMRYEHLVKQYENIMKSIKSGVLRVEEGMIDDYLLAYYSVINNKFSLPEPKYKRYKPGKPPILGLFIDDCLCTKLMSNRKFYNLVKRHRHLRMFPTGGAVGLLFFIAVQTYKAQSGGLNKCVRNNATSLCLSELEQIAESFSVEVSSETFMKMYEKATDEPHSFLFVDLHKKKEQSSMFRKRFDEYLIPDVNTLNE